MMSDAPAHHLFCLLSPVDRKSVPDIFVIIQVKIMIIITTINIRLKLKN